MMQEERYEKFASVITGIYRDIQKIKAHWNDALGMKSVHVFWVYLLRSHPEGLTASQLSKFSQSNRSLVSREINNLVEQGYVQIICQTNHRRYGARFCLTEQGRAAAARIGEISMDIQRRVSGQIPAADLECFYRTCNTLLHNFDQIILEISEESPCL